MVKTDGFTEIKKEKWGKIYGSQQGCTYFISAFKAPSCLLADIDAESRKKPKKTPSRQGKSGATKKEADSRLRKESRVPSNWLQGREDSRKKTRSTPK